MLILLILLAVAALSIVYYSVRNGISPMPTSPRVQRCLINTLPQTVSGTIVELGSGWGTLAFGLARKYPDAKVIAYETSPIPYLFSKLLSFFKRNLTVVREDIHQADLERAGLVTCYLYPGAMLRLSQQFHNSLSNTLVVTHTFALPNCTPKKIAVANDFYKTKIYFYSFN